MRIGQAERNYVLEVLDWQFRNSSSGMMTERLEQKFAEVCTVGYAISFINGTATMHAALVAGGVRPGDEVIVPPLTMSSTTFAVLHAGAIPVFADIDPNTWLIDPASIRSHLSARTKAVIPVALYGLMPDMDAIMAIAAEHGLFVLEDDAQCFLGRAGGRVAGSMGHASSFSFQSSKHMTSGEGGMITTNDKELAERIRRFNSLGYAAVGAGAGKGKIAKDVIQEPTYERHSSVGFNYRMPELCAAVALGQLERLDELVDLRKDIAALYSQAVQGCRWLTPQQIPPDYVHSYWTWAVHLADDVDFTWRDFRTRYLADGGDGVYGAWLLTYLEPAFRGRGAEFLAGGQVWDGGICANAERIQPRLIQFKTNYNDLAVAERKAHALRRTIRHFGG